jgi:hypothetical protein
MSVVKYWCPARINPGTTAFYNVLFADDTGLSLTGQSEEDLKEKLQIVFSQLLVWLNANRLSLNASKTKCIIYSRIGQNAKGI